MKDLLESIINNLRANKYKNEEQIRFSLVARILQKLDWDIWNPEQVYTEYKTNQNDDDRKVNIALFLNDSPTSIFIEIKSPEKLNNPHELRKAETQLKDYNADLTALFTILTDGNQWRFYYSQEGGTFSKKRFKTVRLLSDAIEDIESAFEMFLKKDVVQNGDAKTKAFSFLQLTRKQQTMEVCLPQAKRETESDPLLNLVDALVKTTAENGLNIATDEALEFIRSHGSKQSSTIIEHQEQKPDDQPIQPTEIPDQTLRINYGIGDLPDLTSTRIEDAVIGNSDGNKWSDLMRGCIKQLLNNGWSKEKIKKVAGLNVADGHLTEKGYQIIPGTQYSVQNVPVNQAARTLIDLSRESGLKLEVNFFWISKNKKGRITVE